MNDEQKQMVEAIQLGFDKTQQRHADEIKTAVREHLNGDHHRYVETVIEESRLRKVRIEAIKANTFTWGLITGLSATGIAVYNFFIKGNGS